MSTLNVDAFGSAELQRAFLTLGISPGDLASVIEQEVRHTIKDAKGDRHRAVDLGFRRMQRDHLLTEADVKRLEQVSLVVFQVEAGETVAREGLGDPRRAPSSSPWTTRRGAIWAPR